MKLESIGNSGSTASSLAIAKLCKYCSWLLVFAMLISMMSAAAAFTGDDGAGGSEAAIDGADGTGGYPSADGQAGDTAWDPEWEPSWDLAWAASADTTGAEAGDPADDPELAEAEAEAEAEAAEAAAEAVAEAEAEGEDGTPPEDGPAPGGSYDVDFYVSGELYNSVEVPEGGFMTLPAAPGIPDGYVSFVGWFLRPDASDQDTPYDVMLPVTQPLSLHAVFSSRYLVQFMHGTGEVCRELSYRAAPGERISAPTDDDLGKVTMPQNAVIEFWTEASPDDPDPQPFEWEALTLAEIGHDVILRPAFYTQVYVTFISYGDKTNQSFGGLANPIGMKPGTNLSNLFPDGEPYASGRDHYSFAYWTLMEDGDGPEFDFDAEITENTILYAKWEPIPNSATYYIAYFLEKENLPQGHLLDPTDVDKRSDFVYIKQETKLGTPGDLVTVEALPTTGDLEDPLRYAQTLGPAQAAVSAADDTVICVFARRIPYDLTFRFEDDAHYMMIDGVKYDNASPYVLEGLKYGQRLIDIWPVDPVVDEFVLGGSIFAGYAHDDSNPPRELWLTHRVTMNWEMMPADVGSAGYDVFCLGSGSAPMQTTRYFYEQLPGQTGDFMFTVVGNGSTRTYVEDEAIRFVKQVVGLPVNAKSITGMYSDADGSPYPVLKYRAKTLAELGITTDVYDALPEGERDLYTITNYFYTRHRFNFYYNNASIPPVEVMFGQPLHEDPAPPGAAGSLYVADPPPMANFEFNRWTQDPQGILDFDWSVTMPDNDYAAFAIWTATAVAVRFWDGYPASGPAVVGTASAELGGRIQNFDGLLIGGYSPGLFVPGKGEFICWDYEPVDGVFVTFPKDTPLYEDLDLYARWRKTSHKITYVRGDADYAGPLPSDPNLYEVGTFARVMNLPQDSSMMDAEGNLFVGWHLDGDATGRLYYPYSTLRVDDDSVLSAVFMPPDEVVKGYFHINWLDRTEVERMNFWRNNPEPYYLPTEEHFGWAVPDVAWIVAWQTEPAGGDIYEVKDPFPVPADVDEIHLYAVWNATYTLTFDGNGDSQDTLLTITVPQGSVVNLAESGPAQRVSRLGYDFGGWSTRRFDPSTKVEEVLVEADMTVYAYWNGVQNGEGKTTDDPDEPGDPDNPDVPSTPSDPDNPDEGPWQVIEDPIYLTLTFDGNGDEANTMLTTAPMLKNTVLLLSMHAPRNLIKPGYDFNGWSVMRYDPRTRTTMMIMLVDTTVYAYWNGVQAGAGKTTEDPDEPGDPRNPGIPATPNYEDPDEGPWYVVEDPLTVTLTLDSNGGSFASGSTTYAIGDVLKHELVAVAQRAPQPTRSGYTFGGWLADKDNVGSLVTSVRIDEDTTLFALWTRTTTPTPTPTPRSGNGGNGTTNGGSTAVDGSSVVDIVDVPGIPLDPANRPPEFIDDHIKYIEGYPDGLMHPDSPITRAETSAIIFRLLRDPDKDIELAGMFIDVTGRTWHAQSINYLASKGIVSGYPDGTFLPDAPITRAEFAKVVAGYDNLNLTEGNMFVDTAGHWAEGYINSAANRGWVSGYPDGMFMPGDYMTRAEVVSTMNRMLVRGITERNLPSWAMVFPDIVGHWAYLDVIEASNEHDYVYTDGTEQWAQPSI